MELIKFYKEIALLFPLENLCHIKSTVEYVSHYLNSIFTYVLVKEEKNASMVEVPVHFAPYSQPNLLPASQLMGTRNVVIANKEENKGEKSITRGRWTEEEDNILRSIIEKIGNTNDWHKIANKMPRRNAKQCKERYDRYFNLVVST